MITYMYFVFDIYDTSCLLWHIHSILEAFDDEILT